MFMLGGPSQIDLFDPKPELTKWHGKNFPGDVKFDNPAQAAKEYQELQFEVSALYRVTNQLSLRFDLEQEDIESSDPRGEYDRLRTGLSVYWEF